MTTNKYCTDFDIDLEEVKDFSKQKVIVAKKYKIISKVGEGGTSNVYKASLVNNPSSIYVALKVIKKHSKVISAKKRFELEGETLMRFSSNENILSIYDYFECGESSIIVMEYLKGKTLKSILKEKQHLSIRQALDYTFKITNALKEMHSVDIMHRDLKPQNIIIDADDDLKLMDFGIIQASEDQDITQTNYVVGSVEYMAPEILRGKKSTPRSEIYSLGVIMYMMLTGVTPLKGMDFQDTAKKHLQKIPDELIIFNPNLDLRINRIVLKMMRSNDFERYHSIKQLENELYDYLKWLNEHDEMGDKKKLLTEEIEEQESKHSEEISFVKSFDKRILVLLLLSLTFITILIVALVLSL